MFAACLWEIKESKSELCDGINKEEIQGNMKEEIQGNMDDIFVIFLNTLEIVLQTKLVAQRQTM